MTYVDSTATDNSATAVIPSGSNGDVFAAFTFDITAAPAGYVLQQTGTVGGFIVSLYTRYRDGGDVTGANQVFTSGGTFPIIHLVDMSNVNSTPVSSINIDESLGVPTVTGLSVNATGAGTLCLGAVSTAASLSGTPAGMTLRQDHTDDQTWTQEISGGSTGNRTLTGGASPWSAIMAAFGVANPVILIQPQSQILYIGQSASFTVSATGTGTLSYQWKENGVNVGTNTDSYSISPVDYSYNGNNYTVDITDDIGTTTSNIAILTIIFSTNLAWFSA